MENEPVSLCAVRRFLSLSLVTGALACDGLGQSGDEGICPANGGVCLPSEGRVVTLEVLAWGDEQALEGRIVSLESRPARESSLQVGQVIEAYAQQFYQPIEEGDLVLAWYVSELELLVRYEEHHRACFLDECGAIPDSYDLDRFTDCQKRCHEQLHDEHFSDPSMVALPMQGDEVVVDFEGETYTYSVPYLLSEECEDQEVQLYPEQTCLDK